MATIDYKVNYEDERFQQSDEKYDQRETDLEATYAGMIGGAENIYQPQIDALEEWGEKQAQLQQANTNFTIQQINQQKQEAQKDYQKEQSAAYVDWRKQSSQYGVEAEKMASSGMLGTGYSESSQVSMYNTYQNRVAQAKESYDRVIMNYNNSITEARLQNNSILAEIAFNTLSKQLELITEGTIYKNNLILDLADKKMQLQQMRDNDYYKILDQINTENALAEDVRQFNENLEFQATQNQLDRDFQATQAELDRNFEAAQNKLDRDFEAQQTEIKQQFEEQQAELDRQHDFNLLNAKTKAEKELAREEYEREKALLKEKEKSELNILAQQHKNDLAVLEKQYQISQRSSSSTISKGSGSSGGSSSSSKGSGGSISTNKTTKTFTGSTYEEAVSFLKSIGWNRASGIMTMNEWSRRKNAGSTAAEVKNYSTYQAYLKGYCAYAVAQTYG